MVAAILNWIDSKRYAPSNNVQRVSIKPTTGLWDIFLLNGQIDTSKNIITTSLSVASDKYELKTEREAKTQIWPPSPPSLTGQIKLSSMTHLHSIQTMQPLYTLHTVHLIMKHFPQRWWAGNNLPSVRSRVTPWLTGKRGRFKCKRVSLEQKVKPVKYVEDFLFCNKSAADCHSERCSFIKDDVLLAGTVEKCKTIQKSTPILYFWHLHAVFVGQSCLVKPFLHSACRHNKPTPVNKSNPSVNPRFTCSRLLCDVGVSGIVMLII